MRFQSNASKDRLLQSRAIAIDRDCLGGIRMIVDVETTRSRI